jgi:TonB-dependent starch-binding outer membrane protein SusC
MKKNYRSLVRSASVFLLLLMTLAAYAQKKVVTGTITDVEGSPLPGVSVIIKGTTTGQATDSDGKFSIEADSEDILLTSFIGYSTQEIKVGSQSKIDFKLIEDISTLQEVVVVGYGEMKRADLTSAQSSISSKDIQKTLNTTIEQAIQGRAAGVYVTQNSGQPGGGMSVNIRGISSINGTNEPLYVIDNIQISGSSVAYGASSSANPLAGLNPSDIESIEILQGPSATAVYGSRATNGVVLITTKRGKAGDMKINYQFTYALQTKPKTLEVMNLRQYAQMVGEYHAIAGGGTPDEFLDPSLLGEGTNWQKELFKNAPLNKHQLSLSGGNDKTTYYLSGEIFNQEGVAIGSKFDRYNIRLNLDNKLREWLSVGTSLNFNQTKDFLTSSQENVISTAIQMSPQVPVKNFDGTWGGDNPVNGANQFSPVNPIAIANLTSNEYKRRQLLGDVNVGVKLLEGLMFRSSISTNVGFGTSTYFVPKYAFGTYNRNTTATLRENNSTSTYWKFDQRLEYTKQIGSHSFNLLGLHEAQESTYKSIGASRTGFLINDLVDLNLGTATTAANSGGSNDWAMESYLAKVSYNYGDRYILNASVRRDGSALFGSENKWGTFPSVSAAWRVTEEAFFSVPVISDLKLRLETGTTGNQGWGGFYSRLNSGPTEWGTGFLPANFDNQKIKWEETKTDNIGLNLGLFDNKVQFEFDYYIKNTDNLIMRQPLPLYMGSEGQGSVSAPIVNIGSLQNKGWSAVVKTVNLDGNRGLRWESNFNISAFKSEVKSFYNDGVTVNRTSWWMDNWTQRSQVGEAPWLFRGYIEEGLFQSREDLENSALPVDNNGVERPIGTGSQAIWVGDVKFKDISGPDGVPDGKITADDETNIGNPWPKFFGGFVNDFTYKGITLSVVLTYSYGNDIYNYVARANTNPNNINLSRNLLIDAFDYAKLTTDEEGNVILANPETNVARLSNGPNGNYARHTSRWVEDGSYIRIRSVNLSYGLPKSLLSKQNIIKGVQLSVSAQNLATFTKYSGYDPEVGASIGREVDSNNQAVGVDNGRYPLTPVYTFSIGLDF